MVPGELLLDQAFSVVLEDDEMANQVQKPLLVEHPLYENFELHGGRWGDLLAFDRLPGHEPLPFASQRPDSSVQAIRNDQHFIEGKKRRDLRLVGLELPECRPDVRVFIRRILEFHHGQRQAVDENDHIGSPAVVTLDHGELVYGKPVVVPRVVEIDQPRLISSNRAIRPPVLHVDTFDEHLVECAIVRDEGGECRSDSLLERFVQGVGWNVGIQLRQRRAQTLWEVALREIISLCQGSFRFDQRAVLPRDLEPFQPVEGGSFEVEFGEGRGHVGAILTPPALRRPPAFYSRELASHRNSS